MLCEAEIWQFDGERHPHTSTAHFHRQVFNWTVTKWRAAKLFQYIFNNNRLFVRFCTWWQRWQRQWQQISSHIRRTSAFNCFFFFHFFFRLIQKLYDKVPSGAFRLEYNFSSRFFPLIMSHCYCERCELMWGEGDEEVPNTRRKIPLKLNAG